MNLVDALEQLKEPVAGNAPPLRVFLACGFTPLHLATFLAAHLRSVYPDRQAEVSHGLFGDLIGNLERLRPEEHDTLVVVIEWPDLDSRLGLRTLGGWQVEKLPDIINSVGQSLDRLSRVLQRICPTLPTYVCLPTLPLPPLFYTGIRQSSIFELNLRRALASFAEAISTRSHVPIVSDQLLNLKSPLDGRFNLRTEITQGFPYKTSHAAVMGELLAEIISCRKPKKGLITDLDGTLWAGILGDVGVDGIHWHLDQHSQLHGIYQQFLASLASAGILIAVASKNDAALVENAFERNDLLLPKSDIFPIEAHWGRKSESVRRILEKWNVLPDSVMEVAEVQSAFPQMECILFSGDDYAGFWDLLHHLRNSFAKGSVSEEDSLRLESIRASGSFSKYVEKETDSTDDFLLQSEGCLTFTLGKEAKEARAFELVNKTNQFNLNGRRYDEAAWSRFLRDSATSMVTISYEDRFGKLGRIAVLIGRAEKKRFILQTWVMSCRAFSRRIEFHCLQYLFERFGVDEILLEVQNTERNSPLREFLQRFSDGSTESGLQLSRSCFFSNAPGMPHKVTERVLTNG
jgi:FkbH-like protein